MPRRPDRTNVTGPDSCELSAIGRTLKCSHRPLRWTVGLAPRTGFSGQSIQIAHRCLGYGNCSVQEACFGLEHRPFLHGAMSAPAIRHPVLAVHPQGGGPGRGGGHPVIAGRERRITVLCPPPARHSPTEPHPSGGHGCRRRAPWFELASRRLLRAPRRRSILRSPPHTISRPNPPSGGTGCGGGHLAHEALRLWHRGRHSPSDARTQATWLVEWASPRSK